jgi:hypothetical protein
MDHDVAQIASMVGEPEKSKSFSKLDERLRPLSIGNHRHTVCYRFLAFAFFICSWGDGLFVACACLRSVLVCHSA